MKLIAWSLALMITAPIWAAEHQVKISGAAFNPPFLEVKKGDKIVWTNDDPVPHTVTGKGFKSGTLESGKTFAFVVKKKGKYPYHCDLHENMTGTIVAN